MKEYLKAFWLGWLSAVTGSILGIILGYLLFIRGAA